ncbi:MAG: hypothetical protein QXT76_00300 [Sulfolobales archaeon]
MIKFRVPSEIDVLKVIARYGSIKGTINLHNLVHELQTRGVLKTEFSFVKYSFGYYSKDLEETIYSLKKLNLIKVSKGDDGVEIYEITDRGLKVLEAVLKT